MSERGYQAHEFAELAGVTVRALHHYDSLGLLKPERTEAGYRLYRARDLERLEEVVALRFIGFSLKQIKELLDRRPVNISAALRRQRKILEEKRRLLDSAISAIQKAEADLETNGLPDAAILKGIIEVIEMQKNPDWMLKYYSDEAKEKIESRRSLWSPELQARVEKEWMDLFRDVEAVLEEDPAGEKAQALADRWMKLVEGFTGGDPQISTGLKALYADRPNWPADFQQKMAPFSNNRVWEFMNKAIAHREQNR
ncbi:MAG: MerR family transcriptional regulator [Bryobacteraceae bacterium]